MSEFLSPQEAASEAVPKTDPGGGGGLVLSIVGLVSLGVLSPIALIVNLIGIFKRPNWRAVIGLALSGVGCQLLLTVCILLGMGYQAWQFQRKMEQIKIESERDFRKIDRWMKKESEKILPPGAPRS